MLTSPTGKTISEWLSEQKSEKKSIYAWNPNLGDFLDSGFLDNKVTQKHPFHLVDPSPWPLFTSVGAFTTTFGGVLYFHGFLGGEMVLSFGFLMILYVMSLWWRDVIREATFQGHHTFAVQTGLRMGIILFIVSEVMFFMAFFWAFFHSSLAPTVDIGAVWPPKGIEVLNPWEVPFLNTVLL